MNTLLVLGIIAGVIVICLIIRNLFRLTERSDKPSELHSRNRYSITEDLTEQLKSRRK